MRKARYDMQQVICKNSSLVGYSSNIAKPGYWVAFDDGENIGRVLGRISRVDGDDPHIFEGWLCVMSLGLELRSAGVRWVNPLGVTHCYEKPPHSLLTWITDPNKWVKNKGDIARLIAMAEFGTTQEQFIATCNNPDKPYNQHIGYNEQFILS